MEAAAEDEATATDVAATSAATETTATEATEGKDWKKKLTPQNQLKVVKQVREIFDEMAAADRAKQGAASQRQVGADDAAMVQKADKGK